MIQGDYMLHIPNVNIAIAGKIRSAKTFCSDLLVKNHNYSKLSFATPLKKMLKLAREEWWWELHDMIYNGPIPVSVGTGRYGFASEAVKSIVHYWADHWGDKDFISGKGRDFLQFLGTDYFRKQWPDYWVQWFADTLNKLPAYQMIPGTGLVPISTPPFVVDDVRFPNELEMLKRHGFLTLRCDIDDADRLARVKPEDLPFVWHPSECALDECSDMFDGVIDTSVAIEDQYAVLVDAINTAYQNKQGPEEN